MRGVVEKRQKRGRRKLFCIFLPAFFKEVALEEVEGEESRSFFFQLLRERKRGSRRERCPPSPINSSHAFATPLT